MPIYTYESPNSLSRLANKLVVVDTSYLQDLSDPRVADQCAAYDPAI